jgi:hypothetical protein
MWPVDHSTNFLLPTTLEMRFLLHLSRKLNNLDEVTAVFKYFENYGRIQEFSIYRVSPRNQLTQDYFTKERDRTIFLTYDEKLLEEQAPKLDETHVVKLQVSEPQTTKPETEVLRRHPNDKIKITIERGKTSLAEAIERRSTDIRRTSPVAQAAINRRLLNGFEGFNGELTKLWEKIAANAKETSARKLARDRIRNDRNAAMGSRKGDFGNVVEDSNEMMESEEEGVVEQLEMEAGNDVVSEEELVSQEDIREPQTEIETRADTPLSSPITTSDKAEQSTGTKVSSDQSSY